MVCGEHSTTTGHDNRKKNNIPPNDTMADTMARNAPATAVSAIAEFYRGKTVFITGGTGFMGKVLLEKLLRSCSGVAQIYLLIRPKKGQDAKERLQQLLSSPLFDCVRKERPSDLQKVVAVEGDITQPELAICPADRQTLARSVHIVFHSAATVKFDEKLKLSVTINLLGTQRLVELCRKMVHLEALIHVSTAYCNCDLSVVQEQVYPPPMSPSQMVSLVECLDEGLLDQLTGRLVGRRPNTYTLTKALAESWLREHGTDLPLVIVRPSIVLSSVNGPLKGWLDNWNGPTGIIAAAGKGLFRSMLCSADKVADLVPVDMVINLMLAAAWKVAATSKSDSKINQLTIYNCSTGIRRPITWKQFVDLSFKYLRKHPFSDVNWYPDGTVTTSRTVNTVNQYLLHWMPAYVFDCFMWLCGKKPMMVRIQDKLHKAAHCLEYFTTQEWRFEDHNVVTLNRCLSEVDRREFDFDVSKINWEEYVESYVLGIKRFIFKEDLTSISTARRQMSRLYWLYRGFQIVSVMCLWHFLALRCAPLRQLWSRALRLLAHLARTLPLL